LGVLASTFGGNGPSNLSVVSSSQGSGGHIFDVVFDIFRVEWFNSFRRL
jgi:hypothetical protein